MPLKKLVYAGRLWLRVIEARDAKNLIPFVHDSVAKGSTVKTDGWSIYQELPLLGYQHDPLILAGDPDKAQAHLPMIHLVFSNLKTWILGTHHGAIAQHHLQAYLNEYVFRFNRRFYPMTAFATVLGIGMNTAGPTYRGLYDGQWDHHTRSFLVDTL